ncbi:hypothetical protein MRB53_036920 [Persea americana]|nr:hypothetical protein MRB53_036920 [Persea americana]
MEIGGLGLVSITENRNMLLKDVDDLSNNSLTNINNGEQRNTFVGLMSRDVPFDDGISNSDTDPNIPFYYMPWVMGAVIYLLGLLFLFHWIG